MATPTYTAQQNQDLQIALGAANAVYDLNKTGGANLQEGKPLTYQPDMAGMPGYQALPISAPTGYIVNKVLRDDKTGLDSFIAYNPNTNSAIVGIAGVNGLGKSNPGSAVDTMQTLYGMEGQVASFFQNGGLEIIRQLSERGGAAGSFKLYIGGQSGAGTLADILALAVQKGLNRSNNSVTGWDLETELGRRNIDSSNAYNGIEGLQASNIVLGKVNALGSEYTRDRLGMGNDNAAFAEAAKALNSESTSIHVVTYDIATGVRDIVPSLNGGSLGRSCEAGVNYDANANGFSGWLHRLEGGFAQFLAKNGGDLNACVAANINTLPLSTTLTLIGLFRDMKWEDNTAGYGGAAAMSIFASALAMPGEIAKVLGMVLNNGTGGMSQSFLSTLGAFMEGAAKYAAVSNPAGFLMRVGAVLFGSRIINGLIGSPTPEQAWLAGLPKLTQGGTRETFTAADTGDFGRAMAVDRYADYSVYRSQDGMTYTLSNNGDYTIKLANNFCITGKKEGGGGVFYELPGGQRTPAIDFAATEYAVYDGNGGFNIIGQLSDQTSVVRNVRFENGKALVVSITTTTEVAPGVQDVKVDTNGDGKTDNRTLVDAIGNELDLGQRADLLAAEQLINQLNDQGALGQGFYHDFTQWNANTLVSSLGAGLDPGSSGSPFGGLGQGLSFDPIGAFYESKTGPNDNAVSIAAKTAVLLGSDNRGLAASELAARDANRDGALRGTELAGLVAWVDANEDGAVGNGEISGLAALGLTEIRATDYAMRTAGNSRFADGVAATPQRPAEPTQPARVDRTQAVPAGNYRELRDGAPFYIVPGGGIITWKPTDVQINFRDLTSLVGTDGDDAFDVDYYARQAYYFQLDKLQNFYGGNGNDQVGGSTRSDNIWGGFGNDRLYGYAGDDKLYGEDGADVLLGQDGQDYLDGGIGNDTFSGGLGDDVINGGDGDDAMIGFTFSSDTKRTLAAGETDNDSLYGGRGNDMLNGDVGNDYLDGGEGDDAVLGGADNDIVFGGSGADEVQGGDGNDLLLGEAGNDRMFGQTGDDIMWGGDGDDVLLGFTASNESKQSLNAGETDNDRLYGGAGGDNLYGGLGDDFLDGGDGNDLLAGEQGNDTLLGGNGNDELSGEGGNDRLMGEAGEDRLFGEVGDDLLWGGEGDDILLGFTGSDSPKQTLAAGETDNDKLYGGAGNDLLWGGLGADQLYGETGDDELAGGEGNDALYGGQGDDRLFGQLGDDILYGGDGDDILLGFTGANETKKSLGAGETDDDWLYGGAGSDLLLGGEGRDYLDGGAGADIMEGGKGDDTYIVNSVNDSILEKPGGGYDVVVSSVSYLLNSDVEELRLIEGLDIHGTGNALDNRLVGNSANNILDGVTGKDTMIGGAGDDTYYVDNAADQIIELAGEGIDTVQSSISYTLGAQLENLVLLDFSKPEKGLADGEAILVFGYPKLNELDYMQGDAVPDYEGTCALTAIANLLKQADRASSEGEVIKVAIDNEWTVTDPARPAWERGGSNYRDQQNILNRFGMRNELLAGYNETAIANLIQSGRGVIIAVNAGKLWDNNAYAGNGAVNHVVTVTGVAYGEQSGQIKGFYIADSGRAKVTDMTRYVSIEKFRNAADVASAYAIYTIEPIKLWDENVDGTGNALSNNLLGNRGDNILRGLAGNDRIEAGDGNDVLIGGTGDDTLKGGAGNDEYRFNLGDGQDRITTSEGVDTLVLGAGIRASKVSLSKTNGQTVLRIDAQNSITFTNAGAGRNAVDVIRFDDGTRWSAQSGNISFNAIPIGSVTILGDYQANQTLVATSNLRDADGMGRLHYQWQTTTDGLKWTNLAGATAASYKLTATEVGKRVRVVTSYTDGHGQAESIASAAGSLVQRANTAPVMRFAPPDQRATEGRGFSYALPQGVITDADPGDQLTWRATLASGAALPSWLKFNAATRTFSGTPGQANIGSTSVRVMATDKGGLSAEVRFDLAVSAAPGLNLTGTAKNDYLKGAANNDSLNGAAGNDLLQAQAGRDVLTDTVGNNLLDGGLGADTLTAGNGNDFLIGGKGNDTLVTGGGRDIIAFNRGDGQDTVRPSTSRDNTLSIGGGVRYRDLAFKKTADDLVLAMGADEQITFKDWYGSPRNHSVNILQMVIEGTTDYNASATNKLNNKKVEQFNFEGLVSAFDKARAATPAQATWNLIQAMASFHVSGSDTAAMGGGLAYSYGRSGNLSALTAPMAQALLGGAQFGASNQVIQSAPAGSAPRLL